MRLTYTDRNKTCVTKRNEIKYIVHYTLYINSVIK